MAAAAKNDVGPRAAHSGNAACELGGLGGLGGGGASPIATISRSFKVFSVPSSESGARVVLRQRSDALINGSVEYFGLFFT